MSNTSEVHRGAWWLADQPDNKVQGVLTIESNGSAALELSGRLNAGSPQPNHYCRIVGEVGINNLITLERCFLRVNRVFTLMPTQQWHVHETLFGAHFSATEPWAFYDVRYSIPGLTRWTRWQAVEEIRDIDEQGVPTRIGAIVTPRRWPLWVADEIEVGLASRTGVTTPTETSAVVESSVRLHVQSARLLSRSDLYELAVRPTQALLGLATGKYTPTLEATVTAAGQSPDGHIANLRWRWEPIEGTFQDNDQGFAFVYQDFAQSGTKAMCDAFTTLRALAPVLDLYQASLRPVGYAEVGFNIVAQALEVFHRIRSAAKLLPPEIWAPLHDDLAARLKYALTLAANDEPGQVERLVRAQNVMLGKLGSLHELSLSQRLKMMMQEVEPHAQAIAGQKLTSFVREIVENRNFFTHWDSSRRESPERGAPTVMLRARMMALLEILLLRALGFGPDSKIEGRVLNRRLAWLQ
jgi:hypothetical protein